MLDFFVLLGLFQLKHFLCDFPLQNAYMLGKMKENGWITPLLAHAGVHSIGTFIIVSFWDIRLALFLMVADLILHFIVDRVKASPKLGGRYNPSQPYFWWALGLDQMAHHLINYSFIYLIVS